MENRRKNIVDLVNQEGSVTLQQLRDAFPTVSDVTLRKDLSFLDSTMQLVRTHGGAKSLPAAIGMIDNFYTRITVNTEAKNLIAQKATQLMQPNLSVYLAPGTTCIALAKVLPDIKMQFFTDGIATAMELAKYTNIQTTIFGGELDTSALRTHGPRFFATVNSMHFDYAILSADNFRPEHGFICCSDYLWNLLKTLRAHADKLIILLDSSKVNTVRAARFFPTELVDIVVTDGRFDDEALRALQKANVTVL